MLPHLLVIAKAPVPGSVKTRLCPPYTFEQAAAIAAAALTDTLLTVAETPARARTLVVEGEVGNWLPTGFNVVKQRGGSLDQRLAAAFADAESLSPGPMFLVGMDTPQLTTELLAEACRQLDAPGCDAVLGPATDGGWWGLGLQQADASLLLDVRMSTQDTFQDQLVRLLEHDLHVNLLPRLTDVDDAASAAEVAELIPDSRFAAQLADLAVAS